MNKILNGDAIELLKNLESETFHLILSDIPYGISYDEWDVLHQNTNSALLGSSPAQEKAGSVFKKRGKPLNGWSEADKKISKEYYKWCIHGLVNGFVFLNQEHQYLFLLGAEWHIVVLLQWKTQDLLLKI